MINLLPSTYAETVRYARQNTSLRIWLFGIAAAIVGLALIFTGGALYINQQSETLQRNIDSTRMQLKTQNLTQVQKDAKEITGDIKIINKVLASEVRFSALIQAIGNDMPPGSVLDSLSLAKTSGAIDLSASAKNYNSAAQIAVNLSTAQNKLFSKVDIQNVSCDSSSPKDYKCVVSLKALFSKASQTQFLSVPKENQ